MTNNTDKKIIWVDDDVNNPELQTERYELERIGIDVIPIVTADEFLEFIANTDLKPDCLIMDISMAVGNVLEIKGAGMRTGQLLIEKWLEKEHLKGIPIVIYSQVNQDDGLVKLCTTNKIPYWSKSDYMPDEFAERVLTIIDNPNIQNND